MKCLLESVSNLMYISNGVQSDKCILWIGGLGDNMTSAYVPALMEYGIKNIVTVISIQLESMPEYGLYTIDTDIDNINTIYSHLNLREYKLLCMLGHSTGCQVLMKYSMRVQQEDKTNLLFILQDPVSDREYEEKINLELPSQIEIAKEYSDRILPFKHCNRYIRGDRFLSLFLEGGQEDIFSLGQSTKELNPLGIRTYSIISKQSEYITVSLLDLQKHLETINGMKRVYLIDGNHTLTGEENTLLGIITEIFKENTPDQQK
ncbi:hypothetical protein NEOKW01_1940 [Nematocida sp. AWRm80]|nr:hypothetical protein NEOKW01_1940 [Nematocida sp. AWRm80]